MKNNMEKKAATSVSVIGGEDGPTSVFLVGKAEKNHKEKNIFRRIRNDYRNRRWRRKRKKAEKEITPGAHSPAETEAYIKEKYGAVEADASYFHYAERKAQMKCSLLQRERPELLDGIKQILPPENLQDTAAVQAWMKEVEAWTESYQKKAEALPDDIFPMEYHLYLIDRGEACRLEVEMEYRHQIMSVSGTGNLKEIGKIEKDIYRYFGVTEEDIKNRTERYGMLVTILAT